MSKKLEITNIKDFFFKLESILEEYYEKELDEDEALSKIGELKNAAKEINLDVNIGDNILNNISPSSSYSYTSSYDC